MTTEQTISWIFLATAMASQTSSADFNSISLIADGINHAVPTHKELQTSMTWLINNELIIKSGNKYSLTEKGKFEYDEVYKKSPTLLNMLSILERSLKKYNS